MKKKSVFYVSLLAIVMSVSSCGQSASQKSEGDSVKAESSVVAAESSSNPLVANGLPTIVDFSAEWCPPCRQLKPIFHSLKEEYTGKVDFVTVNVDSMPQLAEKYNISSIPALVYLDADGKEVYRSVGFQPASAIKSDIATHFSK